MNNVGKPNLLPHHFGPTCRRAPLPVQLHAGAQLLSTWPAALWEVNVREYSQTYFWVCFFFFWTLSGLCDDLEPRTPLEVSVGRGGVYWRAVWIPVGAEAGQSLRLPLVLQKQPANPLAGLSEKELAQASGKSSTHRLSEKGRTESQGVGRTHSN